MFRSDRGLLGSRSSRAAGTQIRIARWAAGLWAVLIFVLSSIPGAGSGGVTVRGAVLHIAEYAVLAGLLRRAGLPCTATIVVATLYGLGDEFHQAVVPGRDASFADVGFDSIGAAVGAVFSSSSRKTNKT